MAAKTTLQELDDLRTAIQNLIASGASSITIDGITYQTVNMSLYQQRERELYRRLTISNVRKRTTPDFS
jgi:hypothetical protein